MDGNKIIAALKHSVVVVLDVIRKKNYVFILSHKKGRFQLPIIAFVIFVQVNRNQNYLYR